MLNLNESVPTKFLLLILFIGILLTDGNGQAPNVQDKYKPLIFNRQEVMVPVRDGVKLQTVIFTPKRSTGPLPFLIMRTPYGVPEKESLFESGSYDELIADGYIFVVQNIRGRFKSEGDFLMNRPPRDRSDSKSIDEGTDTYDTIEWLLKNVPEQQRQGWNLGHLLSWMAGGASLD